MDQVLYFLQCLPQVAEGVRVAVSPVLLLVQAVQAVAAVISRLHQVQQVFRGKDLQEDEVTILALELRLAAAVVLVLREAMQAPMIQGLEGLAALAMPLQSQDHL